MKQHYLQIDIAKGMAIVAVLLLHSLPKATLINSYAIYHIWQAVPVFMVIMGLNLGLSSSGKQVEFKDLYTRNYFRKKASRILQPFLLIFILSLVLGLLWLAVTGENKFTFSQYTLVGVLPLSGRGNYFITLLLQSVLLLPLIGYWLNKKPIFTSIVLILAEVAFLLLSKNIRFFDTEDYLYDAAFPRYFSAIALGYWLSKLIKHKSLPQLILLFLLAIVSMVYLYLQVYQNIRLPYLRAEWQTQNLLAFAYAGLLILLIFWLFPNKSENKLLQLLGVLGKASYHIFLVQVIYFGIFTTPQPVWQCLILCILFGWLFYKYEAILASPIVKSNKVNC